MALSYGVVGFLLAAIIAVVLSTRLERATFQRTLLVSGVLSVLILAWVGYQVMQATRGAPTGPTRPLPAPTAVP
jgi:hypothetical protein